MELWKVLKIEHWKVWNMKFWKVFENVCRLQHWFGDRRLVGNRRLFSKAAVENRSSHPQKSHTYFSKNKDSIKQNASQEFKNLINYLFPSSQLALTKLGASCQIDHIWLAFPVSRTGSSEHSPHRVRRSSSGEYPFHVLPLQRWWWTWLLQIYNLFNSYQEKP